MRAGNINVEDIFERSILFLKVLKNLQKMFECFLKEKKQNVTNRIQNEKI